MHKFMWLTVGLSLACNLPAQVEPNAGQWKTWIIASGSALRLPAPPDAGGTTAEIQWVKDCIANRNQAVLAQIHFWDAGAPGYRWMQLAEQLAVSEGLSTPLQTRALSLLLPRRFMTQRLLPGIQNMRTCGSTLARSIPQSLQ